MPSREMLVQKDAYSWFTYIDPSPGDEKVILVVVQFENCTTTVIFAYVQLSPNRASMNSSRNKRKTPPQLPCRLSHYGAIP